MLKKEPACRFRREEEIGMDQSLWDSGWNFEQSLGMGLVWESEHSSLEIETIKERIDFTEISYLWSFGGVDGGKKASNWTIEGVHTSFMKLCHFIHIRVTECKTAVLKKTLEVIDWFISPISSLACDSTSMPFDMQNWSTFLLWKEFISHWCWA